MSAVVVAALTLAGMFLLLFVGLGDKSPHYTLAKMVVLAAPGVIVYPVCWYMLIFRQRDYSLRCTLMLVGVTFGIVSAVILPIVVVGSIVSLIAMPVWRISPFLFIAAPLGFVIWFVLGAIFLAIPYALVAAPMALLHRHILSRCFRLLGPTT